MSEQDALTTIDGVQYAPMQEIDYRDMLTAMEDIEKAYNTAYDLAGMYPETVDDCDEGHDIDTLCYNCASQPPEQRILLNKMRVLEEAVEWMWEQWKELDTP